MKQTLTVLFLVFAACGRAPIEPSASTSSGTQPIESDDVCAEPGSPIYPSAGFYTLSDGTTLSVWHQQGASGDTLGLSFIKNNANLGGFYRLSFSRDNAVQFRKDSKPSQLTGGGDVITFYFLHGHLFLNASSVGIQGTTTSILQGQVTKVEINRFEACAALLCENGAEQISMSSVLCNVPLPVCAIPKNLNCDNQRDSQETHAAGYGGSLLQDNRFAFATSESCEGELANFCETLSTSGVTCSPVPNSCQCDCVY